jgi:hypothetical protein
MSDMNLDEAEEYERQSVMLARSVLHWLSAEGHKVGHITIRGLIIAAAWVVAESHVSQERTDVEGSVELIAEELRTRIPEFVQHLREG